MSKNIVVKVEITDTFYGEANYSWVKRSEVSGLDNKSETAVVRAVKKAIGWSNLRCRVEKYGEMIRLTPFKDCMTCFITFHREE